MNVCDLCDKEFEAVCSMRAHRTHHFKNEEFYKTRLHSGRKKGYKVLDTSNYKHKKSEGHRKKLGTHLQKIRKTWKETLEGRFGDHLRGKTYEEIFSSKEKAVQRSKVTSDWMKTDRNIRRFVKHPSRPQLKLFEKIKKTYPDAVLEHPIKVNGRTIWLDIAIPKLKINYEYDGSYWHKDSQKDEQRDLLLKGLGWKIIRYPKEGAYEN